MASADAADPATDGDGEVDFAAGNEPDESSGSRGVREHCGDVKSSSSRAAVGSLVGMGNTLAHYPILLLCCLS